MSSSTRLGRGVVVDVAFGLAFTVSGFAGRATIVDGSSLSLVWPAAGVAVLWFLVRRSWAGYARSALVLALATVVVNRLTEASWPMTGVFVTANLVLAAVTVWCLRRLVPDLWGCGGRATFASTRRFAGLLGAAFVGSLAGASLGALGALLVGEGIGLEAFLLWSGRSFTGVISVATTGHLLAHAWARRAGGPLAEVGAPSAVPPPQAGVSERIGLAVATVVLYVVVFAQDGLPLAFPLCLLSVWAGLRLPTTLTSVHSVLCGSYAVALTLEGTGPFGMVGSIEERAALTQLFVATVAVTGMFLATSRDERSALVDELQSAQLEAASRAELWLAVVEAMDEGLMVMDADGDVLISNAAARTRVRDFAARGSAEDRTSRLHRSDGTPLPWAEHPARRAFFERRVPFHDVVVFNPDHTHRVLAVTATALDEVDPTGSTSYAVVIYRDVTDERERADQLAAFAGVVAHDLRSPLTGCRGWIDWARNMLAAQPEEVQAAIGPHLQRARASTIRMDALIEDLLSQVTSEGQRLEIETIDVADLLEEVAASTGAELEVADLPPVRADRSMLRQLLSNLLGNAAKYVAPGVEPLVTVTGEARDGTVVLCLRDNGIGIPEEHQAAVFEKFHRAHADDDHYTGTGLGLAICRTIVERHGGTIRVADSAPGRGTAFEVTLPSAA